MKKNIKDAIKEHLYANSFVTDPNNPGFVDRFFEHTKAAEWGAEWRINSVWHSITVIPDCHRFIVFLPKKSTIGSKNPIMGILEENKTFISSRPGCILCRLDEMESWAYLDDLLP